jgi:hypothetical protein
MTDWQLVEVQGFSLGKPRPTSAGPKFAAAMANPSGGNPAS